MMGIGIQELLILFMVLAVPAAIVVAIIVFALAANRRASAAHPNLIACPDCGGRVSTSAAACPHCGRPNTFA